MLNDITLIIMKNKALTTDYLKHRKWQRKVHLNSINFNETPDAKLTPSQKYNILHFFPVFY